MGSNQIVILLPAGELLAHILEGDEHFHIQALITEPPIETFDETILDGLARPNKIQLNTVAVGPGIHNTTGEFAPIIHGNSPRRSSV